MSLHTADTARFYCTRSTSALYTSAFKDGTEIHTTIVVRHMLRMQFQTSLRLPNCTL